MVAVDNTVVVARKVFALRKDVAVRTLVPKAYTSDMRKMALTGPRCKR